MFCINKGLFFLTVIVLMLLLVTPFLSKNISNNSKAAVIKLKYQPQNVTATITIKPTPTLAPLTADPKKVLDYWIKTTLDKNKEKKSFTNLSDSQRNEINNYASTYVSDMTYIGDLDYEKNYGSAQSFLCISYTLNDPLGLLFNELKGKNISKNSGLKTGNQTLTFFKNDKKTSAILASWKIDLGSRDQIPHVYAMRYYPYKSFVNGFSSSLFNNKIPLVSDGAYREGCSNTDEKNQWDRWVKFAESVINDQEAIDIPGTPYYKTITPAPTQNLLSTDQHPTLNPIIYYFMNKFTSIYLSKFPELVLYPLIDNKTSTMEISNSFSNKEVGFLSFGKLYHLTYYLDTCPNQRGQTGNFSFAKIAIESELNEWVTNNEKAQQKNLNSDFTYVVSGKTFINYPFSCANNFYDGNPPNCTTVLSDKIIYNQNSFFLTLKPIKDSSCIIPDSKEINYMIYLGK